MRGICWTVILLGFCAGVAAGQSEFTVNTTLDSTQRAPRVVTDAAGGCVVVWSGFGPGGLAARREILMQRFDPAGSGTGGEVTVNTTAAGDQEFPAVAMNPQGTSMVVAWSSVGAADSMFDIRARLYLNGTPAGPDFVVNTTRTHSQSNPDVSIDSAGNFVVVWDSWFQDGSDRGIFARQYGPDGSALGDEFRVNASLQFSQAKPAIAHLSRERFVVVWESWGQDVPGSAGYGVVGRLWNGNGTPATGEFAVNTYTVDYQWYSAVTDLGPDRFVVGWCSWGQDGGGGGIYCRIFTEEGVPLSGEIAVNNTRGEYQWLPRLSRRGSDGFAVAWSSWKQDGDREGVMTRAFDRDGNPVSFEQLANEYAASYQWEPDIAPLPGGDLLAVWSSWGSAGKDYEIAARRMTPVFVQARLSSSVVSHPFWRSTTRLIIHVHDSLALTGDEYEMVFDSLGNRAAEARLWNTTRGDTLVRGFPVDRGEDFFYLTPETDGFSVEILPEFDLELDLQRSSFVNRSGTNLGFVLTPPGVTPAAKRTAPVDAVLIWGSCDTLAGGRYSAPLDTAINASGQRVVAVPFMLWNLTDNQKMEPFVPETKVNQRWDPGELIRFRTPIPYRVATNEMHAEIQTIVPGGSVLMPGPGDTNNVLTNRPIRQGERFRFATPRSAILGVPAQTGGTGFALLNNFPNPFNPQTTIPFTLPRSGRVLLEVYTVLGQRVATLVDGFMEPGQHRVPFDASRYASGVYFCRLSVEGNAITRRIAFIR